MVLALYWVPAVMMALPLLAGSVLQESISILVSASHCEGRLLKAAPDRNYFISEKLWNKIYVKMASCSEV